MAKLLNLRITQQKNQWQYLQQNQIEKKRAVKERRRFRCVPRTHIKSQSYYKKAANKRMILQELILLKRDEA